jgi:hypothetical protein
MMRALCIGGGRDGDSWDVEPKAKVYSLPERLPLLTSYNPNDYLPGVAMAPTMIRYSVYQLFELHGPKRKFYLLVHESMTLDGAMHALLQGYKK